MLVRDVTTADPYLVESQAAGAYELLIELSALPREGLSAPMLAAMERVGDRSGEVWLHLLGLAVDAPWPRDAAALLAALEAASALEVRRQLLGTDVPAWRHLAPGWAEAIDAAAAGDAAAQARLLGHPRYYGGAARQALEVLLPLGPEETRRLLLEALGRWHQESFAAREAGLVEVLEADARATTELAATMAAPRTATTGRPPPRACCALAGPSGTSSASASWAPWPAAPVTWTSWPARSGCPGRPSTTTWACYGRPGWSGWPATPAATATACAGRPLPRPAPCWRPC